MKSDSFSGIILGIALIVLYFHLGTLSPYIFYLAIIIILVALFTTFYPIISKKKRFSRAQLESIDVMTGYDFEEYISYLLKKNEFQNIKLTPKYDQGIDIIAKKNGIKYGFQCKRWKKKVGNKAIQEVHAGIGYYSLDIAVVITNNFFTKPAQELAKRNNVELWDRNTITRMIEKVSLEQSAAK